MKVTQSASPSYGSGSSAWRAASVALLFLVGLVIGGCATRPGAETLVPTAATAPGARTVTVLLATDRASDGARRVGYDSTRAALRYEELTVSVPPGHQPGNIEWTEATARDPERSFVVTRRRALDETAFRQTVASRGGKNGTTGIFAHGYNYTLTEAVFRVAQLSTDTPTLTAPILFSWPSEAAVTGYVADRDAATYARDDLARVLDVVGGIPTNRKIMLAGHSMGGWLVKSRRTVPPISRRMLTPPDEAGQRHAEGPDRAPLHVAGRNECSVD